VHECASALDLKTKTKVVTQTAIHNCLHSFETQVTIKALNYGLTDETIKLKGIHTGKVQNCRINGNTYKIR